MRTTGTLGLNGVLRFTRLEKLPDRRLTIRDLLYWSWPHPSLPKPVRAWRLQNFPHVSNQLWRLWVMLQGARLTHYPFMYGQLFLDKIDGHSGVVTQYGLASLGVITTVGRDEVVDEFDAATAAGFDLTTFNFHGIGTGTNAEAVGDTTLQTELTTPYNPDNTRATGTQTQPTSDVYRTVGTNTLDSGTPAVTEHGILSQAATAGGTLLDRSVFAAINLVGANGDALQSTYNLTIASGG